jgi:hypothetical protein
VPSCESRDLGLQVQHRRFDGDVEREPGDAGIRQMVACFTGKHGGNGVDAAARVFCDESLADAAPATPGRVSARTDGHSFGGMAGYPVTRANRCFGDIAGENGGEMKLLVFPMSTWSLDVSFHRRDCDHGLHTYGMV